MSRAFPDFIIAGAAKSGTTVLYEHLVTHPSIFIPSIKECRFFSNMPRDFRGGPAASFMNQGPRTWGAYQALFQGQDEMVCGDICNDCFFYYERSIENIKKYVGTDLPIVIILRNPVERAYSHYLQAVRMGSESKTFEEALALEPARRAKNYVWSMLYRQTGLSADATESFLSNFRNVQVYLYEEIFTDNGLRHLQEFIGVSPISFDLARRANVAQQRVPKSWFLNKSVMSVRHALIKAGVYRSLPKGVNRLLGAAIRYVNARNVGRKAELAPETRRALVEYYEPDVRHLENLLSRDLRHWRA